MATPVLNNGIFLRDTSYKASSHVDSYHLTQMLGNPEPMDMGPIDLWAMTQKVEMPLYQMASFGGKNTIMVDNARGEYKWQTPIAQDLPYIVADIEPANASKGVDGTLFKIKINKELLDMVTLLLMISIMDLNFTSQQMILSLQVTVLFTLFN